MSIVTDSRYLLDDDIVEDPYAYFGALRSRAAVAWSAIHRGWLVLGYTAAVECLRSENFTADRVSAIEDDAARLGSGRGFAGNLALEALKSWMVFADGERHRQIRVLFQPVFGGRFLADVKAAAQEAVSTCLAELPHAGDFDLVHQFAVPVVDTVNAMWLGVPSSERPWFIERSHAVGQLALGTAQDRESYARALVGLEELALWFEDALRARQPVQRDDLLGILVRESAISGHSAREVAGMLTQVAFAGNETTSNLIANGALAVLRSSEPEWRSIQDWPAAVEELVRYDGPSKMSIRVCKTGCIVAGVAMQPGDRVFVVHAAANRDPDVFREPDSLDLSRRPNPHLGFGKGRHYCIGAPLARIIGQGALSSLFAAAPRLSLSEEPSWVPSLLNRELRALRCHLS